jgi:hypothetical protein
VIRASITILMVCLLPIAATAQTTTSGGAAPFDSPLALSDERLAQDRPSSQGPMIVERVHSGFLVAPDFKITEVDKRTSELAGGYAGWLTDDRIFIGGGGYWLANQSRDREMAYGGLVVQWLARTNARLGFSVKGLVGGGAATLSGVTLLREVDDRDDRRGRITTVTGRRNQAFFVAEPEGDVLVRLTRHMRLTVGAGYRFTSSERGGDSRLQGAVGTLGVQIGGGS